MEATLMELDPGDIVYDAEYLEAMLARRRAQNLLDAAYQAATDVRVILATMRAAKDAPRWRELHERLEVAWRRYRTIQDWRYER
jgi:hypothetical protein